MFTLPPFPPKDYVVKDVPKSLQSSSQFTPNSELRGTQSNLGKYCFPVEYKKDEYPSELETKEIEPIILRKWTDESKADWVIRPGKYDFFLHDIFKKYFELQDHKIWDPRFMHKERVFNRSYKLELDCIEAARLEKLRKKCERDEACFENSFQELINRQKSKEKPRIQVKSCETESPFWWKRTKDDCVSISDGKPEHYVAESVKTSQHSPSARWQEEPNLTAFVKDDPCRRKFDMQLVGQPFKNEACNWYYKNYPPPNFEFRPKRIK